MKRTAVPHEHVNPRHGGHGHSWRCDSADRDLSLETVKTRVDSELFSEAEALALGVRRQAAQADSLAVIQGGLELTINSVAETVTLPLGCSVATGANDPDFASVTCTATRGSRSQRNIQPLFSRTDLVGSGGGSDVCYTRYQGQNNSDRGNPKGTHTATVEVINEIIAASGNSGGFIQIYRITDAACEGAQDASLDSDRESGSKANNSQPPNQPSPAPEPAQEPEMYDLKDYRNESFRKNDLPKIWNPKGGEVISSPDRWSGNDPKTVIAQNPSAGSHNCDKIVNLTLQ